MPINAADTISRGIGGHICNPRKRGIAAIGAITRVVSRVVIFGCLVGLVVTWAMSKVWPIAERPKCNSSGTKRTFVAEGSMSAFGGKADIGWRAL